MYQRKLDQEDCKALLTWWGWLDDHSRGDRAVLRRASSPDDVLLTPAFAHFLQKMPTRWVENKAIRLSDAAMVAAVVARVKKHDGSKKSFATSLASAKEGGSKAAMSELRFQQLQKSRTPEEFFPRLCRAIDLLGGRVNIISMADDALHWLSENRSGPASKPDKRLAVRWASDYYAALKD
jgi:CRISPR system Cascade subunit CasB